MPSDCGLVKLSEKKALVERCQMWMHIRLASLVYPTYLGALDYFRLRLARVSLSLKEMQKGRKRR